MSDKKMGLFGKYIVERVDGKPIDEGAIILEWKDPNARAGIAAFSKKVREEGYIPLADDLDKRLESYRDA